jgi:hypothetical protein
MMATHGFRITKLFASATSLHRNTACEVDAEPPAAVASHHIESTQASTSNDVIATPKHFDRVWETDIPSWLRERFAAMAQSSIRSRCPGASVE